MQVKAFRPRNSRRFTNRFAVPPRPPSGAPLEQKCLWMRARMAAKEAERILRVEEEATIRMLETARDELEAAIGEVKAALKP
jgi:hypothetical protein